MQGPAHAGQLGIKATAGGSRDAHQAAACEDALDDGSSSSSSSSHPHLLPKVMVAYATRPGDVPRKVQIQR
jgi:hypothetical protein